MKISKVLAIQMLIGLFILGFIGMWAQNAKGGNVTNCQGSLVACTILTESLDPDPCDYECSGVWPIRWCDDKILRNGDGYCYDAGSYTGINCYEELYSPKQERRQCDCEDGHCEDKGIFEEGEVICPEYVFTSC